MTETPYPTNPSKLPWPQDIGGITAKLQREGCRSIGRMHGDDAQYELVIEVLKVLARHAKAKLADQKIDIALDRADTIKRQEAKRVAAEGDRDLQRRNIRKVIAQQTKRLEALGEPAIEAVVNGALVKPAVAEIQATAPNAKPDIEPAMPVQGPPKASSLSTAASEAGLGAPKMG